MSGANANWPLNSCELCLYSTVQLYSGVREKNTVCFYKDAQTDLLASATRNLLLIMHGMIFNTEKKVYFLCLILKLTNCAMIIKTAQLL